MWQCVAPKSSGRAYLGDPKESPDIRLQLQEQMRCLDNRMETQVAVVAELQDFFRRRGELELDYSKSLDKLSKSLQLRHKEQKQKREHWPLFSSFACWQQLIIQTKNLSRDHAVISEIYTQQIHQRLNRVTEDVQRIYRRCREIGTETHDEILRLLHELHQTMKLYHGYQTASKQAETKLTAVENQRLKCETAVAAEKWLTSKKNKWFEKEVAKKRNKYRDARVKELKARNEYLLCLEAANVTIHKFFVDDMSDLIDCMDFGFYNCISRALKVFISAEEGRQLSVQLGMDTLNNCISSLDSRMDKQKFLEAHHQAFMIPKKIEFQGQKEDISQELIHLLTPEMNARLTTLNNRIANLRAESDEVWKTIESTETTLLSIVNANDYDCKSCFGLENKTQNGTPNTSSVNINVPSTSIGSGFLTPSTNGQKFDESKLRADRHEIEDFYITKFREYLLSTTRIARLEAKQIILQQQLSGVDGSDAIVDIFGPSRVQKRKRIGRMDHKTDTKLFGGSLEEYLEKTNEEIPLIMKSCIRVINLYGLHHQGIFRVSGSQVEINNFREVFERGEDPLADMTDASDINSVAGVLKLYLRELLEPLFPILYFDQLMAIAQISKKETFISKIREVIAGLSRPVKIVMRYLFAFLHHLSEFSDENMMDPYNLAICFGPTLVPVPDDKDQVQYQNQVNELIKNIITYNDEIFSNDGGTVYEKYISDEAEDNYGEELTTGKMNDWLKMTEDGDSEVFLYPSEDETDIIEATAAYDYVARSARELTITKGDPIILYMQVSNDWWNGSVRGKEGLIPDKYITIDRKDMCEKSDYLRPGTSLTTPRRRSSNSNMPIATESTGDNLSSSAHLGTSESSSPMNFSSSSSLTDVSDLAKPREKFGSQSPSRSLHKEIDNKVPQTPQEITSYLDPEKTSSSRSSSPTTELDNVELRNATTKKHWKSQSVSEISTEEDINVSFSQNRELWQKRASSQSVKVGTPPPLTTSINQLNRHSESWVQRQKHTPDLVMDLPLTGNREDTSLSSTDSDAPSIDASSNITTSMGPESPDMSTAAERFAKQNQCTLKKNTKIHSGETSNPSTENTPENIEIRSPVATRTHKFAAKFADMHLTGSFKPQVMNKPQVLRKPALPITITTNSSLPSTSPDTIKHK